MAKLWPFFLVLLYVKVVLCCGPGARSNDFCVEATLKDLDIPWADDLAQNNPGKLIYKIIKSNFDSNMRVIATGPNYRNRDVRGKLCRFEAITGSQKEIKVFVKISAKAQQADVERLIATTIFEPFAFSSTPRITAISSCSSC